MLPKSKKLVSADFSRLKGSRVFHSPHLLLRVSRAAGASPSRFAAVSSKAVLRRAVDRNLFRRRIFFILKKEHASFRTGFLVVVSAKRGSLEVPFAELREELLSLLRQANVRLA